MANGKMLEVIQAYNDHGEKIDPELFRALMIQDAIDSQTMREQISADVCSIHNDVQTLKEKERNNAQSITALESRNNLTDFLTAVAIGVATFFGVRN